MNTKQFLLPIFLIISVLAFGQKEKDSIIQELRKTEVKIDALPYYSFGKGVGITSPDSLFQFNIRFRMQNRATFDFEEDEKSEISAQIRRLRLRFDGYVGNPKFTYAIQLSFASEDVGVIKDGEHLQIIRDAIIFYRPNNEWSIGFGQTKLPGNRQRINSSGALQLTDRSINNSRFNIDRDFGLQVYYLKNKKDAFGYEIKTAISTGEGRNWVESSENKMAYTGKIELFPFGNFTDGGAYFEGDIKREAKPKLMLSGTYHFNHGATKTQGQRGSKLFEPKDITSVFIDGIAKYNGWAFQSAYMIRNTKDPITYNPDENSEFNYVIAGNGFDSQLSYIFNNNIELIGRYSVSNPKKEINYLLPETTQYSFGINKYIWEHSLKLQAEVTHEQNSLPATDTHKSWYLRFQVELGI